MQKRYSEGCHADAVEERKSFRSARERQTHETVSDLHGNVRRIKEFRICTDAANTYMFPTSLSCVKQQKADRDSCG